MNLFDLLYLLLLLASAFLGAVAGSKFGGLLYGVLGAVAMVFAVSALRFCLLKIADAFPPKRFLCTCGNCKWNDFVWLIVDGKEVKEFKCGRRFEYDENHLLVEQGNNVLEKAKVSETD